MRAMKLTTVLAIRGESTALLDMMRQVNAACNWLSAIAFEEQLFHWLPLQRRAYHTLRSEWGLTATQATVAVRKVAYAYRDKARRTTRARFRDLGGVPLHRHSYRNGMVRVYGLLLSYRARPGVSLPRNAPQAVLCYRDGDFFIQQTIEAKEPAVRLAAEYLGCDLGIVNILADSDGEVYSGGTINGLRRRHAKLRARLQHKGTRSAKRLLRKRRHRESRFARDVNHGIAKKVVAKAQGTGRGVALEELWGIRGRTTVRRAHRRQHHAWSFDQLSRFIQYKAALQGMPVALVDPQNTSRTCPACGSVSKENRKTQALFLCTSCGHGGPADVIAARVISRRAVGDQPDAAARASCKSHDGLRVVMG